MNPREHNPASEALAAAILTAIERAGTTRDALGRKADVGGTTMYTLGSREPTLDILDRLSRAMGLGDVYQCMMRHFAGEHPACAGGKEGV